jgi:hypothetical protein
MMGVIVKMSQGDWNLGTKELIRIAYHDGGYISTMSGRRVNQPKSVKGFYFHQTLNELVDSDQDLVSKICAGNDILLYTDSDMAYNSVSIDVSRSNRYFNLVAIQFYKPGNNRQAVDKGSLRLSEHFGELCVPVQVLPVGNPTFIEYFPYENESDVTKKIESVKNEQGLQHIASSYLARTVESGSISDLCRRVTAVQFYQI